MRGWRECELSAPAKDSCLFWHLHSFGFFPLVNQATLYQHSWHVRVLHTDISRREAACEIVGSSSKEPSQRSKVGKIDQWKVHTLLTSSSATLRILTPFWKAQMAQEHGRGRFFFFFFCTKGDWMKFNIRLEWIWIWFCFTKKKEEKWQACILARFWKNTKCSSLEICSAKING